MVACTASCNATQKRLLPEDKNKCAAKFTRIFAMQWQREKKFWLSVPTKLWPWKRKLALHYCVHWNATSTITPCSHYSTRYNKISGCQHTANIKKALSCQDCRNNAPYRMWKGFFIVYFFHTLGKKRLMYYARKRWSFAELLIAATKPNEKNKQIMKFFPSNYKKIILLLKSRVSWPELSV